MFCTDSCSLVFGTTELKHVTVQSLVLLDWRASNWSTWTEPFFTAFCSLSQALSWLTDQCGALLPLLVTEEHYGHRDCCRCCNQHWFSLENWTAFCCHWQGTVRVFLGKVQRVDGQHTARQPNGVWDCHHCRDLGTHTGSSWPFVYHSVNYMTADQTAKNESALLWAQTSLLLHRWLVAWLVDSIDFFLPYQAVPQLQASTLFLHSCGIQLFQKMWTRQCWDPHWDCVQGWCDYHWANCPNYLHCYNTEHCHGDFEHWGDPNLTVHKWTGELLVHSSFSTVACLSNALDWHHSHWTNQWLSFVSIPHFTVFWQLRQSTSWRQILSTSLAL